MRAIRWSALAPLLGLAVACAPEHTVDPTILPDIDKPHAAVLPASSYTANVWKPQGAFTDVNGANLIVGIANENAVAMVLGGPLTKLSNGPGIASRADAVNQRGEIVGRVNLGSLQLPDEVPAYWRRVGAPPILLPDRGVAKDINDHGLVVGELYTPQGYGEAFAWDPITGSLERLPPLPNGTSTGAVAINNDRVILGFSDGSTVLWQHNGSTWDVRQVAWVQGHDIDSGYGVVGATMYTASFGDPDHAGYFNVTGPGRSLAEAVTGRGVVAGYDEVILSPGIWYGRAQAFVADRSGATTYLPYPAGTWTASFGYGLNDCGLVVGEIRTQTGGHPAIWDPGC